MSYFKIAKLGGLEPIDYIEGFMYAEEITNNYVILRESSFLVVNYDPIFSNSGKFKGYCPVLPFNDSKSEKEKSLEIHINDHVTLCFLKDYRIIPHFYDGDDSRIHKFETKARNLIQNNKNRSGVCVQCSNPTKYCGIRFNTEQVIQGTACACNFNKTFLGGTISKILPEENRLIISGSKVFSLPINRILAIGITDVEKWERAHNKPLIKSDFTEVEEYWDSDWNDNEPQEFKVKKRKSKQKIVKISDFIR